MDTPEQIIRSAIEQYHPSHIFAMFSGGDDSLTVSHFAAATLGKRLAATVHINTGIGLPETRQFVGATCDQLGWYLAEYRAADQGQHYEQLVLAHGFPGPDHHRKMFNRLKERALRALTRDHPGGNVMLISGLRMQESGRRMRLKLEPTQKDGRRVWCAPFFYLNNDDIREYRRAALRNVPRNPAKEYLCMSGECLCGAYARKGELSQIETFFPDTGRYLRDLQRRVRERGFPWNWDEAPPTWWCKRQIATKSGQMDAFENEFHSEVQMLCSSCQFRHDMDMTT